MNKEHKQCLRIWRMLVKSFGEWFDYDLLDEGWAIRVRVGSIGELSLYCIDGKLQSESRGHGVWHFPPNPTTLITKEALRFFDINAHLYKD